MKLLCQILFLAFASTVVVLGCDVNTEVNRIYNEISACSENVYNETTQPFDFIRYYANFRLTYEETREKIYDYCRVFEYQFADCLTNANNPIDEECRSEPTIKEIIDMIDMGFQIDWFMCENEAMRYLQILDSDGPDCYAKNDNYETCLNTYYEHRKEVDLGKCNAIEAGIECVQTYDDCENQYVKSNMYDVYRQLQYQYNCEN